MAKRKAAKPSRLPALRGAKPPEGVTYGQIPTLAETVRMTVERVLPLITKDDFVVIRGRKGKENIEPKRDMALKLFQAFNLSYDCDMLPPTEKAMIVKATIRDSMGRSAAGLGACEFSESGEDREIHDTLARAETRAMKRAIEAIAGEAIINQLILRLYGGFTVGGEERNVNPEKPAPEPRTVMPPGTRELVTELGGIVNAAKAEGLIAENVVESIRAAVRGTAKLEEPQAVEELKVIIKATREMIRKLREDRVRKPATKEEIDKIAAADEEQMRREVEAGVPEL